ncbi:Hypothetical predicted protein [Podarcis lilfordi]|uniref:Uncharacterized protein n=1 Tax=Podarcis lilfordi TaxID=74358 RepID=A0AA35LID7_9SAUR|nr:Hypothetical predicted protein [Podarcis lilfordi]
MNLGSGWWRYEVNSFSHFKGPYSYWVLSGQEEDASCRDLFSYSDRLNVITGMNLSAGSSGASRLLRAVHSILLEYRCL